MSGVVGTAGHIDHGKTTLLRALTGIDADRLPEERRRGMTIEVGYAHLPLPDGSVLDFVDVPGHDRLVGNMLVGAGEIDAALLVVAADDGPNAQTIEHLELLDAIGIEDGLVAVTKTDLVDADRVDEVVDEVVALVARTRLAGSPVVAVSGVTGNGLDALRTAFVALRDRVAVRGRGGGVRLAIDRSFAVRGRGSVVTGSLRGGPVATGAILRLVPGDGEVRVREVQVRGAAVALGEGGRTALLVGGVDHEALARGRVLTADPAVAATSRVLVAMRAPAGLAPVAGFGSRAGVAAQAPADRERVRFHVGTAQAGALIVRGPREAVVLGDGSLPAILRLDAEVAAAPGDPFAMRRPSPGSSAGGGVILDPIPPRGVSRRRFTAERAEALAAAVAAVGRGETGAAEAVAAARLDLHGALRVGGGWRLAPDLTASLGSVALDLVRAHHAAEPASPGLPLPVARAELALAARRRATLGKAAADEVARDLVDRAVADGNLARDGDRLRDPARAAGLPPATLAAMDRLVAALSVAAPPSLAAAAREAGCPPDGLRALETAGRIVRLEDDLAWAAETYRALVRQALAMAAATPLSPAAYRDATGTSRKFVLVILEDLDRRGLLRRTDAGHVLGPKAIARLQVHAAAPDPGSAAAPRSAPAPGSAPDPGSAPEPAS
jgi:selenocysteine-specific elongation factor